MENIINSKANQVEIVLTKTTGKFPKEEAIVKIVGIMPDRAEKATEFASGLVADAIKQLKEVEDGKE